jgi:hypothetical protein
MVTRAQTDKLIAPFRARHPEFVEHYGRWIAVPFTHHVKGFLMNGSADKTVFYPTYFVYHLYAYYPPQGKEGPPLSNGKRFGRHAGRMRTTDDGVVEWLDAEMERIWSHLSRIDDVPAFVDYQRDPIWVSRGSVTDDYTPLAACGHFAEAIDEMMESLPRRRRGHTTEKHPDLIAQHEAYEELLRTLRDEPENVYPLLHRWEERKVRAYGLEQYWRPAPFPLEIVARR